MGRCNVKPHSRCRRLTGWAIAALALFYAAPGRRVDAALGLLPPAWPKRIYVQPAASAPDWAFVEAAGFDGWAGPIGDGPRDAPPTGLVRFAHIPVQPETRLFAGGAAADTARTAFIEDMEAACAHRLDGILLDFHVPTLAYDPRWDGYAPDDAPMDHAQDFGHRLGAALGACGIEALLIRPPSAWPYPPLFLSLFEGVLLGLSDAPDIPIDLMVDATRLSPELGRAWIDRLLLGRFGDAARSVWQMRGGVAWGGSGLSRDNPVLAFESLLLSNQFQWEAGPKSADALPHRAAPLAACQRIGPVAWGQGARGFALQAPNGVYLALPQGLPEPLELTPRTLPLELLDLATGVRGWAYPEAGRLAVGPSPRPVALGPVPTHKFGVPAMLWCTPTRFFEAGPQTARLQFGIENRSALPLAGMLHAVAPPQVRVAPDALPLALMPGTGASADAVIEGAFAAGSSLAITLSLAGPGTVPVLRQFTWPVAPRERWRVSLLGPIDVPLRPVAGPSGTLAIAASRTGEIAAIGPEGSVRWQWRGRDGFHLPPLRLGHWSGAPLAATLGRRGVVRAFELDGRLRWEKQLPGDAVPRAWASADVHPFPGEEVVILDDSNRLTTVLSNAYTIWTRSLPDGEAWLSITPSAEGAIPLVAIAQGDAGLLLALSPHGDRRWSVDLPYAPSGSSAYIDSEEPRLAVPSAAGGIRIHAAEDGTSLRVVETGAFDAWVVVDGPGGPFLVTGTSGRVQGWSLDGQAAWTAEMPGFELAELALEAMEPGVVYAAGADGTLMAVSALGQVMWRDERASGQVVAPCTFSEGVLVYAAEDGVVRMLDMRE